MPAANSSTKSAIVTGAGSGIGRATVELLLAEGWQVAMLDRDETALAALRKAHGDKGGVHVAVLDVTDEAAVSAAIAAVTRRFGAINGVVNSAGVAANSPVLETSAELFRKVLDVNVVGTFVVAREAAKLMKDTGGGSIVNIASISGLRGSTKRPAYGASKGAVVTLTKVMANDLARYAIRVNAVAPGPVETPMVKAHHTAEDRTLYRRFIPMRRYGEPREIASVVHFLLDPARSGYVTGEIIAADGGYRGAGLVADD